MQGAISRVRAQFSRNVLSRFVLRKISFATMRDLTQKRFNAAYLNHAST